MMCLYCRFDLNNSQITPIDIAVLSQSPNEVLPPLDIDVSCLTSESETSVLNSGTSTSSSQGTVQSIATTPSDNTAEKGPKLLDFLKSTTEGRSILSAYKDLLDNAGRRKLCNLIVRRELQDNPETRVTTQRLLFLAQEITEVFTKEHISTYFIPYINYGPYLKKAAKGKLLDCFNNRKREYKKAGLIVTTPRQKSHIKSKSVLLLSSNRSNIDDESVEESMTWLHNSCDPWDIVERYWCVTASKRLEKILDTNSKEISVSNYMNDFPALKKPSGYKLKILELARSVSNKLRDNSLKCILQEYLDLAPVSEEASSVAAFLVLPFLFSAVPTKRKRGKSTWKPSKTEMKDGFITHIKSHSELQETITRRKDKFFQLGLTLQPLVIIVGPNINEITQYFVYVNGTYYLLNSILSSVDCCFKAIHALNLEYPLESIPIWSFVQKGFYQINTAWDTEFVSVNSLLSDIGMHNTIVTP
ncbi:hypothetical protein ACI65C_004428 [Semiaphis heraclei]